MTSASLTYVHGADRMLVGARLTAKGLHVRFADEREGLIPFGALDLEGTPDHVIVPHPHVIEVHLSDGRVEEVPWDFARHYVDPDYEATSKVAAKRGGKVFGERLRSLRTDRGTTQEELARRSGVHRVTIARIEMGEQLPRYQTLQALAGALGLSVDTLIAG